MIPQKIRSGNGYVSGRVAAQGLKTGRSTPVLRDHHPPFLTYNDWKTRNSEPVPSFLHGIIAAAEAAAREKRLAPAVCGRLYTMAEILTIIQTPATVAEIVANSSGRLTNEHLYEIMGKSGIGGELSARLGVKKSTFSSTAVPIPMIFNALLEILYEEDITYKTLAERVNMMVQDTGYPRLRSAALFGRLLRERNMGNCLAVEIIEMIEASKVSEFDRIMRYLRGIGTVEELQAVTEAQVREALGKKPSAWSQWKKRSCFVLEEAKREIIDEKLEAHRSALLKIPGYQQQLQIERAMLCSIFYIYHSRLAVLDRRLGKIKIVLTGAPKMSEAQGGEFVREACELLCDLQKAKRFREIRSIADIGLQRSSRFSRQVMSNALSLLSTDLGPLTTRIYLKYLSCPDEELKTLAKDFLSERRGTLRTGIRPYEPPFRP